MKISYLILFLCLFTTVNAQSTQHIYGTWVKLKITFNDGGELPDENVLKYTYMKYKFIPGNKFNFSTAYSESGNKNEYEINDNYLIMRSPQGGLINSYQFSFSKDTLILLQPNTEGVADSDRLKYYFVRERDYQNAITLKSSDIYSIGPGDTVYTEGPKVYASYTGKSFQLEVYAGIADKINMNGRAGNFSASFIVSKQGLADSVKITEGIDEEFSTRF